jgi:hypothetical protein
MYTSQMPSIDIKDKLILFREDITQGLMGSISEK